jgi:hypothetical protein
MDEIERLKGLYKSLKLSNSFRSFDYDLSMESVNEYKARYSLNPNQK